MVKPAQLAERSNFVAGPLSVSPARRHIKGPAGEIQVEPLTMQVFLLLLDAAGQVVTRDQLFDAGWGGALVGDDSLNRVINRVRRIATEAGPGSFEIETIPRTGYRLVGSVHDSVDATPAPSRAEATVSRRYMLSSAAAGVAALGGIGLWSVQQEKANRRFETLLIAGQRAILFDQRDDGIRLLKEAVAIRPDVAKAQGLLAYTELGDTGGTQSGDALRADHLSRIALKLDPTEPYAVLTQTILQRSMLDVASTEDRLNRILVSDPTNISAMRSLWGLYQSVGLSHRASTLVQRAMALEPLTPVTNYPRAQLLWILGRVAESDRVIDRAMDQWPWHRYVRFARFIIYAFTDRPRAARAMLDSPKTSPQSFKPEAVELWRTSLDALEDRSPASIQRAREANLDAVLRYPTLSSQAVMTLSALGEVDAAFEVANALLVFRQSAAPGARQPLSPSAMRSTAWRFTPWLFTPPSASLRRDARFAALCDGVGLSDYWKKRNVTPDFRSGAI